MHLTDLVSTKQPSQRFWTYFSVRRRINHRVGGGMCLCLCPQAAVKSFRESGRWACFWSQTYFYRSFASSREDEEEGKGDGGLRGRGKSDRCPFYTKWKNCWSTSRTESGGICGWESQALQTEAMSLYCLHNLHHSIGSGKKGGDNLHVHLGKLNGLFPLLPIGAGADKITQTTAEPFDPGTEWWLFPFPLC